MDRKLRLIAHLALIVVMAAGAAGTLCLLLCTFYTPLFVSLHDGGFAMTSHEDVFSYDAEMASPSYRRNTFRWLWLIRSQGRCIRVQRNLRIPSNTLDVSWPTQRTVKVGAFELTIWKCRRGDGPVFTRAFALTLPLWAPLLAFGAYPGVVFVRAALRRHRRRRRDLCLTCGYNLTGNVSGVCPECGTAL